MAPARSTAASPWLRIGAGHRDLTSLLMLTSGSYVEEVLQEGVAPKLAEQLIDLQKEAAVTAAVVAELRRLTRADAQ